MPLAAWIEYFAVAACAMTAVLAAEGKGIDLFGIIGTEKALTFGAPGIVAVLLGIVTGVAGGILRDVLRNEVPLVFRRDVELYATAVFAGALLFVLLRESLPVARWHRWVSMALIVALRLAAMRWKWRLPMLRLRER